MQYLFRKTPVIIFTILLLTGSLFTFAQDQTINEPYSNVIFSYSLQDFHTSINSGNDDNLSQDALYLLGGTITSVTILDPEPSSYYVDIELMDAHWLDSRTLVNYEAYIVVLDAKFASMISSTQNTQGLLGPQTRGLFLLQYYGPTETSWGGLAPVFILVDFKPF